MKKLALLNSFLFVILLFTNKYAMGKSNLNEITQKVSDNQSVESVKDHYIKIFDSLLLEERYQDLIKMGEELLIDPEPTFNDVPIPYLISAYYFINDIGRSNKLLYDTINKMDYKDLVYLLTSSNIAYLRYFNVPQNRDLIIERAIQDYKNNENATETKAGEQIIRFYINDQRYRKLKYIYKKDDQLNQENIFQEFKKQDSIQNIQLYAFYKKHSKYFSVKEVGSYVSWLQPIILSHYDNVERRQTFFKNILEKAVEDGRMEKTSYVHFLLRTESFVDPDFFRNLEKRMEQVRIEYDLPDYLWNPF